MLSKKIQHAFVVDKVEMQSWDDPSRPIIIKGKAYVNTKGEYK